MQITPLGILYLFIIAGIALAVIVIKNKRTSGSFRLPSISIGGRKKPVDDSEWCFNIYPEKIAVERMLKTSIHKNARLWQVGNKQCRFQKYVGKQYVPAYLPDDIAFPPERLARMMGCEPLKKLKSLKFSWLENLAPFAPVVAMLIAAILFIVVIG